MPTRHVVAAGECISSIAYRHGFTPDGVWQAPENQALRELRRNPNVLLAGDVVVIPDLRRKDAPAAIDRRHVFVRRGVPERLRLQFSVAGYPRADARYELEVDGVLVVHEGRTDAEGRLERMISPDARVAVVRLLDTGETYRFALGELDPIDTPRGALARLKNLGFYAGPLDGASVEALRGAVRAFQAARGLTDGGELDAATRDALEQAYGG